MIKINSQNSTYALEKLIGEGSFAKVYVGHRFTPLYSQENFAVKVFCKTDLQKSKRYISTPEGMKIVTALDNLESEIKIMELLNHPNIVRLYELINDDLNNKLYLVMDLIDRGQILYWSGTEKRYICPFFPNGLYPESDARIIIQQLISAVEYLHIHKIVHRDLKPENVLLDSKGFIKLIDFGIAHIFEGATLKDSQVVEANERFIERSTTGYLAQTEGTIQFLAPECCSTDNYSGFQSDIWALGCILFSLFYSKLPFYSENPSELFTSIEEDSVVLGDREISEEGKDLLLKLLDKNPKSRLTMIEIFYHPWILNKGTNSPPRSVNVLTKEGLTIEEKRELLMPLELLDIPLDVNDVHFIQTDFNDEENKPAACCMIL